jgi:hypothetical protein
MILKSRLIFAEDIGNIKDLNRGAEEEIHYQP